MHKRTSRNPFFDPEAEKLYDEFINAMQDDDAKLSPDLVHRLIAGCVKWPALSFLLGMTVSERCPPPLKTSLGAHFLTAIDTTSNPGTKH